MLVARVCLHLARECHSLDNLGYLLGGNGGRTLNPNPHHLCVRRSKHLAPYDLPGLRALETAENSTLDNEVLVNQSVPHAELIATFRRAEADAAHKFGLIKIVAKKGPTAIQTATETAAKAAKRRDSYAKKLSVLGVVL